MDTAGLEEWTKSRNIGRRKYVLLDWINDRSSRQSRAERIVMWGLHTWQLNYGKLITPLIIRELLLKAAQVKQIQHHTEAELSASLRTWGGLCSGYHDDQLNLCKMYNNQNPCYMIGGLQNNSLLTERAASTIYTYIIYERAKGELLVSVYSRVYEANKPVVDFKALRRQRKLNKTS